MIRNKDAIKLRDDAEKKLQELLQKKNNLERQLSDVNGEINSLILNTEIQLNCYERLERLKKRKTK